MISGLVNGLVNVEMWKFVGQKNIVSKWGFTNGKTLHFFESLTLCY